VTIAEFPLQGGGVLLVRVEGDDLDGQVLRGGHVAGALDRAQTTFEAALGTVGVVAQGVLGQLTGLSRMPYEVHVEFGIELNAKAGAILATAGTTAQLTVGLTWRPEQSSVPAPRPA